MNIATNTQRDTDTAMTIEEDSTSTFYIAHHPIDEVIRLNNDGINHTLCGNDQAAIPCFTTSLTILKRLMVGNQVDDEDEDEDECPMHLSVLHSSMHPLQQLQETNYFLFDSLLQFHPRILPGESSPTFVPRASDYHVYCASIILNLSLLHHRQALNGCLDSFPKAERFYNMVLKIIGQSEYNQGTELVVKLAAINNLSEIYLERNQVDAAEEGFQTLARILSYSSYPPPVSAFDQSPQRSQQVPTIPPRSSATSMAGINDQVLEGMLLNALVAKRQNVAPAA